MSDHDDLHPGQFARACPSCGAMIEFIEWPGEEKCPQCGALLFVNGSGQVGATSPGEFPDA